MSPCLTLAPYTVFLMNAIRWRKTNKIPLKTFSVDLCTITANRANSLKNHIETLSWDEDKYATDDELDDSLDFASLPRLTDFLPSTTQAQSEWLANYSP